MSGISPPPTDRPAAPTVSWLDLPEDVQQLLIAAANCWEDTAQSQEYIHQALAIANHVPDALVAAYRYFFYKHNDAAALQVVTELLEFLERTTELPAAWEARSAYLQVHKEEPMIRLYLNAYAASGLVLARLGKLEQAQAIAQWVCALDDRREFGAETILEILTHPEEEDE